MTPFGHPDKKQKCPKPDIGKTDIWLRVTFLIFVFLQKLLYHFCAVAIDADGLFFDLHRAISLVEIQAGIDGLRVVIRHLPERIFANDRRSHSDADFQIKDMQLLMPP